MNHRDVDDLIHGDLDSDDIDHAREIRRTAQHGTLQIPGINTGDDFEDGLEDDDGDQVRTTTDIERIVVDDFEVDDENRPILRKSHRIKTYKGTKYNPENIGEALDIFGTEIYQPPVNQTPVPKDTSKTDEVYTHEMGALERECDNVGQVDDAGDFLYEHIYEELFAHREGADENRDLSMTAIQNVCDMIIRRGNSIQYTPQYIIRFHSDIYNPTIIVDDDIYRIQEMIKTYSSIARRRQAVISPLWNKLLQDHGDPEVFKNDPTTPPEVMMYTDLLSEFDPVVLDDLSNYYMYHVTDKITTFNSFFRRDMERFSEICNDFLMSPAALAVRFATLFLGRFVERSPSVPLDRIESPKQFFESVFHDSTDGMIESLVEYAATDIATNPLLLYVLRQQFFRYLVVNTVPTQLGKGSSLMEPMGRYGLIKRIKDKPIDKFENSDTWLLIEEARRTGHLECTIGVKDTLSNGLDYYLDQLCQMYTNNNESEWDELRQRILRKAFNDNIWPRFVAETEKSLKERASKFVCNEIENRLYQNLITPPFTEGKHMNDIDILVPAPIFAIFYDPDFSNNVSVASVNSFGNIEESDTLSGYITFISSNRMNWQDRKDTSQNYREKIGIDMMWRLHDMLERIKPQHIAVSASKPRSKQILRVLDEVLNELHLTPEVVFAPADAAQIYATCPASDHERTDLKCNPDHANGILIAASMARRMQDPLSELTRLWTTTTNSLAVWSQHRFQQQILNETPGQVHQAIERACLKAVSKIGLNFSLLNSPHHSGPLQFVPGLGPRLAAYILKNISSKGMTSIDGRAQLIHNVFNGPRYSSVRFNAVPFIRFPESTTSETEHPFDACIIPDEHVIVATNIIKLVLGLDPQAVTLPADFFAFFKENRDQLLTMYNQYLSTYHQSLSQSTFRAIASELQIGPYEPMRIIKQLQRSDDMSNSDVAPFTIFRESRRRIHTSATNFYVVLSDESLFRHFAGSSYDAIEVNKEIIVTISRINEVSPPGMYPKEYVVFCQHPSGFPIHTLKTNYIPGDGLYDTKELIQTSQVGLVTEHIYKDFSIEITFEQAAIKQLHSYDIVQQKEPYFDVIGEEEEKTRDEMAKNTQLVSYSHRAINHPAFMDVSMEQAIDFLKDKPLGTYIFRPSSKGNEFLSLTMKFPADVYAHYSIVEKKQPAPGELGKELYIEDEMFMDLEQIKYDFANPIRENLENAVMHRKWIEDPDECGDIVLREKQENPNMLCYRVTVSRVNNQCLLLVWSRTVGSLHEEPIRLYKDRFKYRHHAYQNLVQLLEYFKSRGYNESTAQLHSMPAFRKLTDTEERERERSRH